MFLTCVVGTSLVLDPKYPSLSCVSCSGLYSCSFSLESALNTDNWTSISDFSLRSCCISLSSWSLVALIFIISACKSSFRLAKVSRLLVMSWTFVCSPFVAMAFFLQASSPTEIFVSRCRCWLCKLKTSLSNSAFSLRSLSTSFSSLSRSSLITEHSAPSRVIWLSSAVICSSRSVLSFRK